MPLQVANRQKWRKLTMWLNIANAYNYKLMPLLVWTIGLIVAFVFTSMRYRKDRLRLFTRSPGRLFIVVGLSWLIHFIVGWYVIRMLAGFAWLFNMHWSPSEEHQFWHAVTQACFEMGALSTLILIWISMLLFVSFIFHYHHMTKSTGSV